MKKLILFSALVVLSVNVMLAQPINKQTPEMMVTIGDEQLAIPDYYRALEWYEKAADADKKLRTPELSYKIANLHYMLRDYKKASRYYKRVVENLLINLNL